MRGTGARPRAFASWPSLLPFLRTEEGWATMRKLVVSLLCLALLTAASATSASGAEHGTARPWRAVASGTFTYTFDPGPPERVTFLGVGTSVNAHLGKSTF